jgi:hypothetical protein
VRKEKDDFPAVHELAAANCLIKVQTAMDKADCRSIHNPAKL